MADDLPQIDNPISVFPKPQRMFPEDARPAGGQYLNARTKEDMTGHKAAMASIGVNPGGRPYFNASPDSVEQTGSPGRGSAIAKTNLFKQRAGWNWLQAPEGHEDTSTIVSVEHRGDHHYALNAHFPNGVDLARYSEAKSEPRLRPTTRGNLTKGTQVGSISVRGKEHPVYDHMIVKADGGIVGDPDTDEGITAYHGSPHDFERFDMSKIGTGEGNQSYGHGLYFAQNEDVAKGYRDTLGGHHPGDVLIGDEKHPHWASRDVINAYKKLGYDNETAVMASHFIKEHKGDLNAAAAATWSNDKIPDSVADAIFKTEYATPAGHMYQVHINAHPDHFLDWDKPFHEQSEHVKRSLRSIPEFDDRVARYGVLDPNHKSKISLGEFINRGVLPHSYDKSGPEFSKAYHAAGIKGVKYLDQGSRWGDKKDPTRNYVVFDDKLVNVKRKYAKGGSVNEYPLDADADEHKHSGGHMTWMSPNSFLDKAQEMRGDKDDKHAIKRFEKRMEHGDTLNPLALYPKGGQDGRHRATAAKHEGIKKIPVVQWPKKADGGSIVQRALMLTSKKA